MELLAGNPEFEAWLESNNYFAMRDTPHGVVGLSLMVYTIAIMVGLDHAGYSHRYCYHTLAEALGALNEWAAAEYAGEPEGYIVRKGLGGDKRPVPAVVPMQE